MCILINKHTNVSACEVIVLLEEFSSYKKRIICLIPGLILKNAALSSLLHSNKRKIGHNNEFVQH